MSICSEVYISKDKAKQMVKEKLMAEHAQLIDQAVSGMNESELNEHLNSESDLYYYNISEDS